MLHHTWPPTHLSYIEKFHMLETPGKSCQDPGCLSSPGAFKEERDQRDSEGQRLKKIWKRTRPGSLWAEHTGEVKSYVASLKFAGESREAARCMLRYGFHQQPSPLRLERPVVLQMVMHSTSPSKRTVALELTYVFRG